MLQIIEAFSKACGHEVPYVIDPRRPGDVAENYADCSKAKEQMGWEAKYDIDDMCRDSWNWQSKNPNGYDRPGQKDEGDQKKYKGKFSA